MGYTDREVQKCEQSEGRVTSMRVDIEVDSMNKDNAVTLKTGVAVWKAVAEVADIDV